jgi:Tfp pilus assembly ATPase PilU
VLVCGASGSGKSTTLAALVNLFNETRELVAPDHLAEPPGEARAAGS